MPGPTMPISEEVHAAKYRQEGETFEHAMSRASSGLADNGAHQEEFHEIITDMRFMPAGRVQAAIGARKRVTPYNCYVSGTIEDSFVHGAGSIMERATQAAATMRMGGGIGYDFSTLRPRGALINGLNSNASGPLSFMDIFDAVCKCVASSGHRRGAQMGVLRVDHPDIEEYVEAKQNSTRLTGFNLSIAITDEFMEALEYQRPFNLRFGDQVYKTVDPVELWEKIMRATWDWAEPGVLFIDTINKMNNLAHCETIAATNPCFTGDTKVWTERGHVELKDLVGKVVKVLTQDWNGNLVYRPMSDIRVTQRSAKLVKVTFEDGQTVRVTPNHLFYLRSGGEMEAGRLQAGQSVSSVYRYNANQKGYKRLTNGKHQPLEHHVPFEGGVPEGYEVHHIDEVKDHNWTDNLQLMTMMEHRRHHMLGENNPMARFPERNHFHVMNVNGEANGNYRGDIQTADLLQDRESGMTYDAIATKHGCSKYMAQNRIKKANHTVRSVEILDYEEDVYCGSVDEFHRFFVALGQDDGILVHNCGEQPLPPFGACLLGSFNLVRYINFHGGRAHFSWNQLVQDVLPVVRAMDNVVDRALYPLPEQEREAKNKRRMGLGVTGLANAAEVMGWSYGSPEFLGFERSVMSSIANESYMASAHLAREKGAFPLYDPRFLDSPFVKKLDDSVQAAIARNGIRNSHLTSIAPTGTISLSADNVSSGIEPVFSHSYNRTMRTRDGSKTELVQDYGVARWGIYGKTSAQVTAQEHVDVLCAAAGWVDSAVSKTCNVSPTMEWEDFKGIYLSAYRGGAKGCTTFNSGGKRFGVLNEAPAHQVPTESEAPELNDGATCMIDPETGRKSCE